MTNNILQNTTNPTQTWEVNSCAPEESAVPAQHVTPIETVDSHHSHYRPIKIRC
jgi:hypothetical protein